MADPIASSDATSTTNPAGEMMAGVTYPWPGADSVVGAAEQAYQEGQVAFRQQLLTLTAGQALTTEQFRNNFSAFNMMNMAVISQQMNGTDPLLAANTLAYNAIRNQPRDGTNSDAGGGPSPPVAK